MKNYINIPETNIIVDIIFILLFIAGMFINFSEPVRAVVKAYTSSEITAEIIYPKYTNEDKIVLEVKGYNIREVYWDGLLGQKKYSPTLQEGENTFFITIVGKKQQEEHKIVIIKDTKPPEILSPEKRTLDISQTTSIVFRANEGLSFFKLNGKNCEKVSETEFSCKVEEGTQLLSFSDFAGNEVEQKIEVIRDDKPPKILSQVPGTIYQKPYQLKLKVSDDTANAWLDGNEIQVTDTSITFDLSKDKNEITIKLIDEAGNEAEYKFTIIYKRLEPTIPTNPVTDNDNSPNEKSADPSSEGESTPPDGQCYSQSMTLYGVKTQIFVGEIQSANILIKCSDTGKPLSGKSVSITVKYSDGSTNVYSGTTDVSGIANFNWTVPNKKGSATVTGKFGFLQQSLSFTVN